MTSYNPTCRKQLFQQHNTTIKFLHIHRDFVHADHPVSSTCHPVPCKFFYFKDVITTVTADVTVVTPYRYHSPQLSRSAKKTTT